MSKKKNESAAIIQAQSLIEHVRGKPQDMQSRKSQAIKLATLILEESQKEQTWSEKRAQMQLARMMQDPIGKAFTTSMTDECFRSSSYFRIANQLHYLIKQSGVPQYLSFHKRLGLYLFKLFGSRLSSIFIPFVMLMLRKETAKVILPGEHDALIKHIRKREKEGVRLNLNHLGEAIHSEEEAKRRFQVYLDALAVPEIDYVSIKISTIFSQINLLAPEYTVEHVSERLRELYRSAMKHPIKQRGSRKHKFVNLDMEEYRDLHLTKDAFIKVLDEQEFHNLSAGIVLQAYIPDSFEIQKELTEWAKKRVEKGGALIKIRIVKGANLAMEQFESSVRGWPQSPFKSKVEVDANYKRMLNYGCKKENSRAVNLGIASHNIFDISYALILRSENCNEEHTMFEMLEGMADHTRRVVQKLAGDILLYCPVAKKEDFQHAIAYLIRRLDENTGPENFLRHAFGLKPGTPAWDAQVALFSQACDQIDSVADKPRRTQDRNKIPEKPDESALFDNEPDTDFSLTQNQKWAKKIRDKWKDKKPDSLPLVIGGKETKNNQEASSYSPSDPSKILYRYSLADSKQISEALNCAKATEEKWAKTPVAKRSALLAKAAQLYRERRADFLGAMMIDGGKVFSESDPEISEAIDMLEYYRRQMEKMAAMEDLEWRAKGTILVTPPWNFPCAIPTGGVASALISGNCVLFKPAPEVVLVGWHIVQAFWDAGIPKEVLQFINCPDDPVGTELIKDERINAVILTGGTATAKLFMKMRPGIDLSAETGGKNAMIISAMSDRDLAVAHIIQSAFGHCGQKCSAVSLGILEKELYDDPYFLQQLKEAASSMKVGPPSDLSVKINPLIHAPSDALKRGLTTLEKGEKWLLEPKPDPVNPCIWSPGIKMDVKPGSYTHQTEFFGPILALLRAENIHHAIEIANGTPYGLTSGLHSLDEREHKIWLKKIEAGNLYINRTTTGAIVQRQPFGGTKNSSFGAGIKASGPSYLFDCIEPKQIKLPQEKSPVNKWVNNLTKLIEKIDLSTEDLGTWYASIANYAYCWEKFSLSEDVTKIVGQDNILRYVPRKQMALRIEDNAHQLNTLLCCAAALTCGITLLISCSQKNDWIDLIPLMRIVEETEEAFCEKIKERQIRRIRMVSQPSEKLKKVASESGAYIITRPVLASGRYELLHYLREVSISVDYHRYGNLGIREGELRKPVL